VLTALLMIGFAASQSAAIDVPLTFSPYAGSTKWAQDLGLKNMMLAGGRLGATPLPWLSVEGTYGFSMTETEYGPNYQTDLEHLGLGVIADVLPDRTWTPYVAGGWSQVTLSSEPSRVVTGAASHLFTGWDLGGGIKVHVAEGNGYRAALRLDARDFISKDTDIVQSVPNFDDRHHNVLVSAGIHLTFGGSDRDSDRDGIADKLDTCPDTPRGATVDHAGCPLDTDEDGVFDGIDTCSETPLGAVVTPTGCPTDTDNDGVYDGLDQCANTASTSKVDEVGCPLEMTATESELLDVGLIRRSIQFASGSWEIDPVSYPMLDEVGEVLARWTEFVIEIGGHTDAQGGDMENQLLSLRRAKAVRDYLVEHFSAIQGRQLTTKGYGESHPIAKNESWDGRAKNRRVEFAVLNLDNVKSEIGSQATLDN